MRKIQNYPKSDNFPQKSIRKSVGKNQIDGINTAKKIRKIRIVKWFKNVKDSKVYKILRLKDPDLSGFVIRKKLGIAIQPRKIASEIHEIRQKIEFW